MADPPNTPTHLFIGVLTQGEAEVDTCLSRAPEHFPGTCPPDLTPVYSRDISHFIAQNITEEISAQDSRAGDIILGYSAWWFNPMWSPASVGEDLELLSTTRATR